MLSLKLYTVYFELSVNDTVGRQKVATIFLILYSYLHFIYRQINLNEQIYCG